MQKDEAVLHAMRLMLEGHSRGDIAEWLTANAPSLNAEAIVREAFRRFQAVAKEPKQTRLGFCQEAAREMFRRLIEIGDFAGALKALQELAKLSDAYTAAKEMRPSDLEPDPETDTDGPTADQILEAIRNGR